MGTLDESDELHPRVIIPNYVTGQSNCVARTSYYSVCCFDSAKISSASSKRRWAKPVQVMQESHPLPRDSRSGNPDCPICSLGRLAEVATHHSGQIPLHGRLFAQWMHLAFPGECPYPHKSGTVYYNSMEQWEADTGERTGSTMKELEHWTNHLGELAVNRTEKVTEHDGDHLSGMWSMEEELVSNKQSPKDKPPQLAVALDISSRPGDCEVPLWS